MEKISFDLYLCKNRHLDDERQMYQICEEIADKIGVELFYKPVIIPYFYGKNRQDDGISCICIFKINREIGFFSVHSFNKRKVVYFDLVTPKHIDKLNTKEILKNIFASKEILEGFAYDGTKTWGIELLTTFKAPEQINFDNLYYLIEDIIKTIDMTKISNTIIESHKDNILAVALIAESHIAFIYNKKTKQLYVDIFSCKYFDKNLVNKMIKKHCNCDFQSSVFLRGLKHNNF